MSSPFDENSAYSIAINSPNTSTPEAAGVTSHPTIEPGGLVSGSGYFQKDHHGQYRRVSQETEADPRMRRIKHRLY